jgi:serine/threonine-protein kinase
LTQDPRDMISQADTLPSSASSARVAAGDILAEKYRVEQVLGQGGMGMVVRAVHLQLHQRVAIKLLLPGASPEIEARFLREARAAVRLKSEHVARVSDVGELPSGAPYIVMEYLEGRDLARVLDESGPCALPDAVEYVLHACEAIAEAHGSGIIHRDLKPANLFLTRAADGTSSVKVLDFGISAPAPGAGGPEDMRLTRSSALLGSPLYMSPEQLRSARSVDARSDIWSLGVVLFELLTARLPFHRESFSDVVTAVNTADPPPIATFRSDVPPELEAAVRKCVEKTPENRFQNVAELAWALVPFGRAPQALASAERVARTLEAAGIPSAGHRSVAPRPVSVVRSEGVSTVGSATVAAPRPATRRLAITGAALAVAVAVAGFVVMRGPAENSQAEAAGEQPSPEAPAPPVQILPVPSIVTVGTGISVDPTPPATTAPSPASASAPPSSAPTPGTARRAPAGTAKVPAATAAPSAAPAAPAKPPDAVSRPAHEFD